MAIINIHRFDGGIHISPSTPYLEKYLTYYHKKFELNPRNYQREPVYDKTLLYTISNNPAGLITLQGFFQKVVQCIEKNLDRAAVTDSRTPWVTPDLARVKALKLHEYQIDPLVQALKKLETESGGIVRASMGWGKTYMEMALYAAFNKKNTIVAIPLNTVLESTYKKFKEMFPEKHVGLVGAGMNDISQDITITSYKSLKNCAIEKCEFLMMDEIQEATSPSVQNILCQMKPGRIVGLTFTDKNLANGTDKILKGVFGERLIDVTYQDAVKLDAVVPGVAWFVKMSTNATQACPPSRSISVKLRKGIRLFQPRNELIGKICEQIPKNWQTLIFTDHVKNHLVHLYKYLPKGTKWFHRCADKDKVEDFALTTKEQKQVLEEFSKNKMQFLVATDAAQAGLDIPNLRVVVQASGGSSEVAITQEAGRGCRVLPDALRNSLGVSEKTHFVLVDVYDDHDETLENMSLKRKNIYEKMGFKTFVVDHPNQIDWNLH